jgi:hypothetical protein
LLTGRLYENYCRQPADEQNRTEQNADGQEADETFCRWEPVINETVKHIAVRVDDDSAGDLSHAPRLCSRILEFLSIKPSFSSYNMPRDAFHFHKVVCNVTSHFCGNPRSFPRLHDNMDITQS